MRRSVEFFWRDGFPSRDADAEAVARELNALKARLGCDPGREDIFAAAKSRSSEMHRIVFARSDEEIVLSERLHIASDIANAVRWREVTFTREGRRVVGPERCLFIGLMRVASRADEEGRRTKQYAAFEVARNVASDRAEALVAALEMAAAFRDRFARIAEVYGVIREIDKLLAKYRSEVS